MLFSVFQYTNRLMNKDGSLLILALHMLNMFVTHFRGKKKNAKHTADILRYFQLRIQVSCKTI